MTWDTIHRIKEKKIIGTSTKRKLFTEAINVVCATASRLSQSYLLCYLVELGSASNSCEHGLEFNQSVCHYDFND